MTNRRSIVLVGASIAVALTLVAVAIASATLFRRWRDSTDDAIRREVLQPLPTIPASATDSPIHVVVDGRASGYTVMVSVTPPPGATALQLSLDPNFGDAIWQPLGGSAGQELAFTVANTGYNVIFARFLGSGDQVGQTSVAGVTVDPTYPQATSSVDGPHEPSWIRPFSPTELVVRIEAGRLERGAIEPYDLDNPADGDRIGNRRGWATVERDGTTYGTQVSKRTDAIRRPDRLIGASLDGDRLADGDWVLSSTDDPAYQTGVTPTEVSHIARPAASGFDADGDRIWEVVHDVVVGLSTALQPGAQYRLTGPDPVAETVFVYEPNTMVSPAVRVNQVGYEPSDEPKLAYLAGWYDGMGGTATELSTEPAFRVIDDETGQVVFESTGRPPIERDEMGRGDLSGAPVVALDFSAVTDAGRYRICVDRIGCSHRFAVAENLWAGLATIVARSTYHQRSGTELGPPYTPVVRPRPYHPDDGATVEASTYSLLEAQSQTSNTDFDRLAAGRTGRPVVEAWGGHFDAGDWDRRINHLWYARAAAQLVMLFPETLASLETNIPESGDAIPDLLDEALWTVDLYRRMQLPDGAIRGGIEASAHPPANATSWSDDLAVFAYAPDRFSSYVYAGVAAEMSVALGPYDRARADDLLASSLAAMNWAERAEGPVSTGDRATAVAAEAGLRADEMVGEQRMVAAAALLMATDDARWHELFVGTADFLNDDDLYLSCHAHDRCDAAWLYLQADEASTDASIRAELQRRFVATADGIEAAAAGTAYGWTVENPFVPLVWGLGSGGAPHTSGLLKAYVLTGDQRYRAAAVRSASVALGANPQGRSLLTGIGTDPVRNPQINDTKFGGLPVWPGTPVYGHHQLNATADDSWVIADVLEPAGADPTPGQLPYLWQWYDVDSVALFNEFTVHQSQAEALWTFGTLAATTR